MKNLCVLIMLISLTSCTPSEKQKNNNEQEVIASSASTLEDVKTSSLPAEKIVENNLDSNVVEEKTQWDYFENKDEMRNEVQYGAILESENTIFLPFPYDGGTKLSLVLRSSPKDGNNIFFSIPDGQLYCEPRGCSIPIKFDDNPVENISMVGAEFSTKRGDAIFVAHGNSRSKLLKKIKKSNSVIVEVPFFQNGYQQFKFNVKGLNWDHF
ncbi:hypothetical protein [Neisseria bergeri]|uniref:hypothetical protein n=1 Tax=Neisseria bergeri TaxID=1906581 RepID=UPI0027DF5758|nr:hypothetical protein [Neisseria bergeri]